MIITINILSALSIVMALFIPYFTLLHLNNKLRKEIEGALNRVLELKQYSEITNKILDGFIVETNENLNDHIKNTKNAFDLHSRLHDKTIKFMKLISEKIYSKDSLDSLKEEDIEENDIRTITIIENLADFSYDEYTFKKGFVFELRGAVLFISNEKMEHKHQFILMDTWAKNLWKKILEVNQPKPKRKYTKRATKNEN